MPHCTNCSGARGSSTLRSALDHISSALEAGEPGLLLAPSPERGWFGGVGLAAWGGEVTRVSGPGALRAAGDALDASFRGETSLTAVLLSYEGDAVIITFPELKMVTATALQRAIAERFERLDAGASLLSATHSDLDRSQFEERVSAVREAIAAGDVYVLNLTRRVVGTPELQPLEAFANLVDRADGEMSALLSWGDGAVASVSPERFAKVAARRGRRYVEITPIKGTCPRSADSLEDLTLESKLAHNEKELAEHLMIVDLERNDLGRVCEPGSVEVEEFFKVVATPYCFQAVSRIRGMLRDDATIADLLEAAFPCGSVTGAPKVAAIRIAGELEASDRGAYCGSLVVALPGRVDSSVLIRTLEYRADGTAAWGTGCGITFESDPSAEWEESELKTRPVLGEVLGT